MPFGLVGAFLPHLPTLRGSLLLGSDAFGVAVAAMAFVALLQSRNSNPAGPAEGTRSLAELVTMLSLGRMSVAAVEVNC